MTSASFVNPTALGQLCNMEPRFRAVWERLGPPPVWQRPEGFATLVWFILEQQVSIASARAAFLRLEARLGNVDPRGFLTLSDPELLAIGFSRQKTSYCRGVAEALLAGKLDLGKLRELPDDEARAELVKLRGIGPWTAEVYLVMCLLRPDAFPAGDIALQAGARDLFGLARRPNAAELAAMAEAWRPQRATAARLLWHHYLHPVKG